MAEVTVTPSSSNIDQFAYDRDTGDLDVTFSSGRTWRYFNVPPETHRAFQSAASAGQFLNRSIKPRFASEEQ